LTSQESNIILSHRANAGFTAIAESTQPCLFFHSSFVAAIIRLTRAGSIPSIRHVLYMYIGRFEELK
jgi:hypothetical protein